MIQPAQILSIVRFVACQERANTKTNELNEMKNVDTKKQILRTNRIAETQETNTAKSILCLPSQVLQISTIKKIFKKKQLV